MSPAVHDARRRIALVCGLGVVAIGPWVGWMPAIIFLLAPAPPLLMAAAARFRPRVLLAGVAVTAGSTLALVVALSSRSLLLLPGTSRSDALALAELARLAVQTSRPGGPEVTVSIGVCTADGRDIRLSEMFAAADRSLYDAKRAGRNSVREAGPRVAGPVAAAAAAPS